MSVTPNCDMCLNGVIVVIEVRSYITLKLLQVYDHIVPDEMRPLFSAMSQFTLTCVILESGFSILLKSDDLSTFINNQPI